MGREPVSTAHQLERKAAVLNRQKKLDECIQCHTEALELYKKCLQIGNNKNVLESIQSQKQWNERQIRMLQLKKSYLERTEKEKKLSAITSPKHSQKEAVERLEAKIFRNFETHDSLICFLAERGIINNPDKHGHSTIIEEVEEREECRVIVGNKLPKDDSIVIEELKELSGQLRESVQGLLIQLDDRNTEIEQLKAQIRNLELERSVKEATSKDTETSGATSPLSGSSAADLDLDTTELRSLPQLDAVAIPEIDISVFKQFRIPEVSCKLLRKDD